MAKIYASKVKEESQREKRNMARSRGIATQGMVLLKNDGVLPLTVPKYPIAVFGSGVRHTVKGGTGSGDVNSRSVCNVEQGLKDGGFLIGTDPWLNRYDALCSEHMNSYMQCFVAELTRKGQAGVLYALENPYRDPDVPTIIEDDLKGLDKSLALYIIARTSGEGSDRRVIGGDYELSEGEKSNLEILCKKFEKVVVVLNVGGVIDTEFFRNNDKVGAVLLMSQLGNISGAALTDILTGKVNPSGRLAATWAQKYLDYPCADTFGHRNGDVADEYYSEGIFVGYRWFDSFGVTPAYPFGYGLSYSDFKINTDSVTADGCSLKLKVTVTNIGDRYTGKETVQVYVSQPAGKVQKPYQVLAGFAKTGDIKPGESTTVTIRIALTDLASYDEKTSSWILEKGEYTVRVGKHSRSSRIEAVLVLESDVVTKKLKNCLLPDCEIDEAKADRANFYTYPDETKEYENALRIKVDPEAINTQTVSYSDEPMLLTTNQKNTVTLQDVLSKNAAVDDIVSQLSNEELALLCVGTARGGFGSTSVIGAASTACPGAAGDTTSELINTRGITNLVLADGPAGLRLSKTFVADSEGNVIPGLGESAMGGIEQLLGMPVPARPDGAIDYYQYCTAIPIATALAQTWDMELISHAGDIVGEEMEEFGVTLWLAPGMNIQRNPLCGRNFEYYSEDPFLSGKCASATITGVQKHKGCGACIKHFALNNLEDNRSHNNSHATERTIREIYLRGFEIAVEDAQPLSLMTSYNLLNGLHTANSYELLTSVLRDEWKFKGLVMTDWGTTGGGDMNPAMDSKYGFSDPALCIKAGNDLIMPGSQEDVDAILSDVKFGKLNRAYLQTSAKRVIELVLYREQSMITDKETSNE